jgi:hypothetical protein
LSLNVFFISPIAFHWWILKKRWQPKKQASSQRIVCMQCTFAFWFHLESCKFAYVQKDLKFSCQCLWTGTSVFFLHRQVKSRANCTKDFFGKKCAKVAIFWGKNTYEVAIFRRYIPRGHQNEFGSFLLWMIGSPPLATLKKKSRDQHLQW